VTVDATHLYVVDAYTIRMVALATGEVTTLAGAPGMSGTADGVGAAARFSRPGRLVTDGAGILYVTDGSTLRKITVATGQVITLAGTPDGAGVRLGCPASLNTPSALTLLPDGRLVVLDRAEGTILLLK